MSHFRLLPTQALPGPMNMAADEVMLEAAAERGAVSLRFYTWSAPTLSLGYFQPAAARLADPLTANLDWVRRPSGGAAILHHHELTYCLALPAGPPWQGNESWLCRFHRLIARAIESFGVHCHEVRCGQEKKLGDVLCFLHQTPADLLIASSKVVGSAQRKRRGALMQHGSIILRRSPYAPAVAGILEQSGVSIAAEELAIRVADEFAADCGRSPQVQPFTVNENERIVEVAQHKYAATTWNEKR